MKVRSIKQFCCFLLTVVFLLTAFYGCVYPRENSDWMETMEQHVNSAEQSAASGEESVAQVDYAELISIDKASDYENVYEITDFDSYSTVSQIEFISENELLVVVKNDERISVCKYNIYDGSNEAYIETDTENIIRIFPDYSAVVTVYNEKDEGDIKYYSDIRLTKEPYNLDYENYDGNAVSINNKLIFLKDGIVYAYNAENNEKTQIFEMPFKTEYYKITAAGNFLNVNGYDYDTENYRKKDHFLIYDFATEQSSVFDNETGELVLQDGNLSLFTVKESKDTIYYRNTENSSEAKQILLKSDYETPVDAGENRFVTVQNDPEGIVRTYNTASQNCISEFRLRNSNAFDIASLSGDKRLLAASVYKNIGEKKETEFSIYIILLDDKTPPEGKYVYTDDVDYQNLTEQEKRAYDMGKKYGVTIHLYEEASFDYYPYSPETLSDEKQVGDALDCLENVLEKFPEGFFDELCSGIYTEMEINITGAINSLDKKKTVDARAYYYPDEKNHHIIVADCSFLDFLEQTFAHEIMHAIDHYIETEYYYVENSGYPDWFAYLPKNFAYNDDYFDKNDKFYEDMEYVYTNKAQLFRVYFLESYSKTFACEDRSVMFEYLFVTGEGFHDKYAQYGLDPRFDCKNISERAAYMSLVIRECFDSVKATEQTQWEKALGLTAENIEATVAGYNNAA